MERRFETFPLVIEFGRTRYGLLYFTLTLGDASYETRFSDVYDPILRFKHWLEAVAVGVEQCSFSFEPEGSDTRFDFDQISWDQSELTVRHAFSHEDEDVLLRGMVNRRQTVEAFYRGFLDYDASTEYDRYEWEPQPDSDAPWNGHNGTKLTEIRSPIIDAFLKSAA